jgi:hypothetical protein
MVLLLVAAACASAPKVLPRLPSQGGPPWVELTSDHFVLWTDLPEKEATKTLRQFEQFWTVMNGLVFKSDAMPKRSLIVVFQEKDHWRLFGSRRHGGETLGFYVPPEDSPFGVPFVAYCSESSFETRFDGNQYTEIGLDANEVRQHELGHLVTEAMLPGAPPWIHEGMASYFATMKFNDKAGTAEVGRFPEKMLGYLRATGMDSSQFTVAQTRGANMHRQAAYLRAHVLVSYLLNKEPASFAIYQRLLKQLPISRHGEAWDLAFKGISWGELEGKIDEWLTGGRLTITTLNLRIPFEVGSRRALSDAEVSGTRAVVMLTFGSREAALEHARAAVGGDPTQLAGNIVLFRLDDPIPEDRARSLVAAHPDQWVAWVIFGNVMPDTSAERRQARDKICALVANTTAAERAASMCQ